MSLLVELQLEHASLFGSTSLMYVFCHPFLTLIPVFPPSLPIALYLQHPPSAPPPPPVVQGWVRGGRGVALVVGCGGRCLGIERRGAWPPVCLGAPNESMIHGARGSHRDRIRGALSNRSPERGKRYLICVPRRQLPLGYVCVCYTRFWICQKTVAVRPALKLPHPQKMCSKSYQFDFYLFYFIPFPNICDKQDFNILWFHLCCVVMLQQIWSFKLKRHSRLPDAILRLLCWSEFVRV